MNVTSASGSHSERRGIELDQKGRLAAISGTPKNYH
jgi:hypothetical protein